MSLKTKINLDISSMCRICLKTDSLLNNLFETDAATMLQFCGFLEIEEGDEFPNKICISCDQILIQSYKFKQLCISSKLYLHSLLGAQENLEVGLTRACEQKLENDENSILVNTDASYECPFCEDQNPCKSHYCNALNKTCNTSDPKGSHDTSCDNNKNTESPDVAHGDLSEVLEEMNDVKYQCPDCPSAFEHKQDLFVHQSIHGGDERICNVCQKSFRSMKILKRHLKTHMITKSHICKICNKGFVESSDVIRHERRHHMGIPREKNYECKECGQRFTDQYYLKVHQRKHTGEKPLRCNVCDKSFYDPRSLRVHLDAHKGIKPYLCSYCGKSFLQNAHLRQHMIVHGNEKPFSCTICDKRFTQSTSLQRHQKVHLGAHKCDICLRGFLKKSEFCRHIKEHHTEA